MSAGNRTTHGNGEDQATNAYDLVPYESNPFARTHPDNLATIARLFGVPAPEVETSRVLELGCAAGGNLIPLAELLPGAHFLGVDLSAEQVRQGQQVLDALGLENISLEHRDILELGPALGTFDYIICHGVYSWVPAPVQREILAICRRHLAPQGVAYISYNTYPGWHLRAMVREMMNYHAGRFSEVGERIGQARALLDFLSSAVPAATSAYGQALNDELEILTSRQDAYLFHEHLEDFNDPVYFYRFVERAEANGLRYLGEARLADMLPAGQFSAEVEETLRNISPDLIHMEQYLDFLRNRMFRRTLLCHGEIEPSREIDATSMADLLFASPMRAAGPAAEADGAQVFEHADGSSVTVHHPLEQAALLFLQTCWPQSVSLDTLAAGALGHGPSDRTAPASDRKVLAELMLNCLTGGLVHARTDPDRFTLEPGERPRTTRLARFQAGLGHWVTNAGHESVSVDELGRQLLCHLDGEHDRAALGASLERAAANGEIVVKISGEPVDASLERRALLDDVVEQKLDELARIALLIG